MTMLAIYMEDSMKFYISYMIIIKHDSSAICIRCAAHSLHLVEQNAC